VQFPPNFLWLSFNPKKPLFTLSPSFFSFFKAKWASLARVRWRLINPHLFSLLLHDSNVGFFTFLPRVFRLSLFFSSLSRRPLLNRQDVPPVLTTGTPFSCFLDQTDRPPRSSRFVRRLVLVFVFLRAPRFHYVLVVCLFDFPLFLPSSF